MTMFLVRYVILHWMVRHTTSSSSNIQSDRLTQQHEPNQYIAMNIFLRTHSGTNSFTVFDSDSNPFELFTENDLTVVKSAPKAKAAQKQKGEAPPKRKGKKSKNVKTLKKTKKKASKKTGKGGDSKNRKSLAPSTSQTQTSGPTTTYRPTFTYFPTKQPTVMAPIITPPVNVPTGAPAAVPTTLRYDITLDFDPSVPKADYHYYQAAASRWEQIVIGDIPDVSSSSISTPPEAKGCKYPPTIDDLYICVDYVKLPNGVIGQGGNNYLRPTDGLPAAGFARIDPNNIATAIKAGYFPSLLLHEFGHALGVGTTGPCPSMNKKSFANIEYQKISKCTTNIPTQQPGCQHFDEPCLQTELMTPIVDPNAPLSRMTVGWANDLGYQVNYTAADPFSSSMLGSVKGCKCKRRELLSGNNTEGLRHVRHLGQIGRLDPNSGGAASRRKLSDEGYNNAVVSGLAYLEEKARHIKSIVTEGSKELIYVGDKFVWV